MRIAFCIFFLLTLKICKAQLNGVQWVLGYDVSVLDFRNDTLSNYAIQPFMPFFLTSANICDSSGNLLYYTNGIYVAGADGNQIANGDSLSPCSWTNQQACCGLDIPQGALFLPMPGSSRYYYLFHMSNDTLGSARPGNMYYSIIDAQGNSGKGKVISKNIVCYKGVFREGGMTACKHANGRDWWVIMGDEHNTYYKFLLTPTGIRDTLIQVIGPSYYNYLDIAYSKFSQDGSKYVTGCYSGPVLVMDFDRCSGEFSNPDTLFNQSCVPPSSCNGASAEEFSPNGRFLYVDNTVNINQFDLSLPNPQVDSSMVDAADSSDPGQVDKLQIGPNGKLYVSCFAGGYYIIHAINYPDLKGDSCGYVDSAFRTLTTNSINFPNMVNYQLGALTGSVCDSISTGISSLATTNPLRVLPNPADKYLYVEMGMQGNYEFDLLNVSGQLIATKQTRQVDIFDTEHLSGGVYFIRVLNKLNAAEIASKMIVIAH